MFKDRTKTSAFWLLVLITFWGTSNLSWGSSSPQLTLGDKVSVFSDKAFRKNNGKYFEAIGNVVILSQKDTVYGEVASLNQETMMVKVEGNVRVITKDMTLYGSHLDYNISTGVAHIKNARILTTDFNLVASELIRVNENEYVTKEAEFTTCKDCKESWAVYGHHMRLFVGKYIQIKHGLFKVKGVDVIYVPYIVIPVLSKRETGLLVPRVSQRTGEGFSFEQPFFWAIDDYKDMTLSPTFWAKRGYGGDFQYRHRFSEMSWMELNSRLVNDTIYAPGKRGLDQTGDEFFRYFTEIETHQFWSPDLSSHIRYTGLRDLDFVRDYPQFVDPRSNSSDFGLQGFVNWRKDFFSLNVEGNYLRNQLFSDPLEFDRSYVQVLPRVTLSSTPLTIVQSRVPFFQHIAFGVDGSFTRFRQVKELEESFLRNADRTSLTPYLNWHLLTLGPVSLKSRYVFDQQSYDFVDPLEKDFGKNAGVVTTEFSFIMDKIFGLAYEEKIPVQSISAEDLQRLREERTQGLSPLKKVQKSQRLIGEIPDFESELSKENVIQFRNSYRHSQEFKFLHHYISNENEYGNQKFYQQIGAQAGQFDYEDAIRTQQFLFGANTTRIIIPPQNTLELQWNNTLIKKSPKAFSYLLDEKYLRDNFNYSRIGWFNISQGYLLNHAPQDSFEDRLTRLMIQAGYSSEKWSAGFTEYYFHNNKENIFSLNFTRRFEYLNFFSNYNYNSFSSSTLNSLSFGGQVRPTDVLGLGLVKDMDLEANKEIRTLYSLDIMPHNNCWIFSLNYRKSIVDSRYSFNILFNFGDDNFERYRNDYFGVRRL